MQSVVEAMQAALSISQQDRPRSGPHGLLEDTGSSSHPSLLLQQLLSGDVEAAQAANTATTAEDTLIPGLLYEAPVPRQPDAGPGMLQPLGDAYSSGQASSMQQPSVATEQQQQQQAATYIQSGLALPNSILVTQGTEPMQAAGLINFTFSQSAHSSFVLNTHMDQAGATPVAVLTAALRVVLSARKLNVNQRFDLGFVPFLVTDAADGIGLLIFKCSINPDLAKSRGQVLKMDASSNPLVAGISLFNMVQTGNQQLEVIFTAEASKVALQALSIMRINLANNGRDVLLLLSTVDYTADASGPKNYFLLKLTPITPPLPCFQHQIEAPKTAPSFAPPAEPKMHPMAHAHPHAPAGMSLTMAPPPMKAPHMGAAKGGIAMGPYGPAGMAPAAAAAAAAANSAKQQRARKADYVIVTEDTAIKNAAGAIAKVLGRVSNQGQCCPVYTEKKTESFTTVISVAVKAIAVARGYVCNEGMGHEVGFQPYLRHLDRRLDLMDLHHYLGADKKGMGGLGMGVGMGGGGGMMMGPLGPMGLPPGAKVAMGPYGMQPAPPPHALMMGPAAGGYGMAGGVGGKGGLEALELLDEEALQDERCELAFDVFKVPQVAELQDAGNLPVKVTAHSRPNVVSNIISKLVSERSGAVLITAGGKAMHVAMTAVVSARARLKAKGIDIILLPKFVTVDTTSTLGWESVFLRFTIVRWAAAGPPLLAPAPPPLHPDALVGRYILQPQMG